MGGVRLEDDFRQGNGQEIIGYKRLDESIFSFL